jgi:hypothetical protein
MMPERSFTARWNRMLLHFRNSTGSRSQDRLAWTTVVSQEIAGWLYQSVYYAYYGP